jgi:hypothetical protein
LAGSTGVVRLVTPGAAQVGTTAASAKKIDKVKLYISTLIII